ncbi:unnamed protein product [Microthlaspi erraticum]|uniref:Reverse transcriptase Ty1/copia-type domain-containing protein n=1 Tax=Microthlaspi erraticum TaxID=1685480 RepID=A0A6D2LGR0_9BRAS|nr:unnamed protein product [Microthlaspi erraticum]
MASKFDMSDLGRLTYYLGMEVLQCDDGIMLSQKRYAQKIVEEAEMQNCNAVHTPMESGLKLLKARDEKDIDATMFRKNVGCLRYLLHTRPDLSYCVGVLSRYMQNPKESHGAAMRQCLRYLKSTTTLGLTFERSSSRVPRLIGYIDSSHNVDPDDGKSTTGHIFYLGESPITWCSQKQDTEDLARELSFALTIKSAIALTRNPVFHGRSKHIHTRYHFIRECVENGQVEVEHVPGEKQKADILTKALGRIKFKEMRDLIGMKDLAGNEFKLKGENVELSLKKA